MIQRNHQLTKNEAKLTGLRARNLARNIQQVLILKFAFGPEKFPGIWRNRPLVTSSLDSKPLREYT